MNKITLKEEGVNIYNLIKPNGKCFGDIIRQDDGFFTYDGLSSWVLREIADRLDEVNKPFSDSLDEYFDQERKNFEKKIRKESNNFTKGFHSSTLMVGDNYVSGFVQVDNFVYSMVKYKNKVRIWNTPKNYMAWVNGDKDYILEITI